MHKNGIIHRNLQSRNIFLSKFRLIKIANFNNSYINNKNITPINSLMTTSNYTAPKILNNQKYKFFSYPLVLKLNNTPYKFLQFFFKCSYCAQNLSCPL